MRHPIATRAVTSSLLLLLAAHVEASRFGRDGFSGNPATNGGATCTACHAPGAGVPSITLSGPASVPAGSTRRFEITIRGGPAITAGVAVSTSGVADSAEKGTLSPADGDISRVGQELSHTRPKAFNGNEVTFRFDWTAPAYRGPVTLYVAGNSSNGALDLLGDGIGTATLNLMVEGGAEPPPPPPPPPAAEVSLTPLVSGLTRPVSVRHAGDARLFVVEQAGRILIVQPDGSVLWPAFLDIRDRVEDSGNEQGLLGLAFDPDYADNGFYYVYYTVTDPAGDLRSRISRLRVSNGNPNRSWGSSERVLMEFAQPYGNHNAGDLHFGPDGYLYIASGDGGSAGDPQNFAQNPRSPLGKILRIDVRGGGGEPDCSLAWGSYYGVPTSNAYADGPGNAGCDEIFALGVRNPWRISFDRDTGDLWIADVGQSAAEEVDLIRAGTAAGLNLGWRCYEADQPYAPAGCNAAYLNPLHTARHTEGFCSITGGYVYRGSQAPSLYGSYFYSDFCRPALRTLTVDASGVTVNEVLPADQLSQPVTFGEDVNGELLVASLTGTIYRIRGTAGPGAAVGEAGAVTVAQSGPDQWHQVSFSGRYREPVVVMGPPSRNGGDPLTVRVRNVTASGFEFQLDEWDYRDGAHTGERVGYLAVERGSHRLADGRRLVAGRVNGDHQWQRVAFGSSFSADPLVIVQTASQQGTQAVTERLTGVDRSGFQLRLQEEEANDGFHAAERIHWIAVAPGASPALEAARLTGVDHRGTLVSLSRPRNQAPVLLSDLQTSRGPDTVALRALTNDGASIELMLEEERSRDAETAHIGEDVAFVVLPAGPLR